MALSRIDFDALADRSARSAHLHPVSRRPAPVLPFPIQQAALERNFPNLTTQLDAETGILWVRMQHAERACYTPDLMHDMSSLQLHLRNILAGRSMDDMPFKYLVWSSNSAKAWSLGGDLAAFARMIRSGDREGLRAYAHLAIEIIYENYIACDLPILTIALIQGDAIGGGFEAMLTHDIVIAERHAKFGLPEILFNLFPGMGAYSFLRRKVGNILARTLIEDGLSRSADELASLGLVDIVCESGQGEAALRSYVEENGRRFHTLRTLRQVQRRVDPVARRELLDVVDMWVDLAFKLSEDDLRRMDCLARVQQKKAVARTDIQTVTAAEVG